MTIFMILFILKVIFLHFRVIRVQIHAFFLLIFKQMLIFRKLFNQIGFILFKTLFFLSLSSLLFIHLIIFLIHMNILQSLPLIKRSKPKNKIKLNTQRRGPFLKQIAFLLHIILRQQIIQMLIQRFLIRSPEQHKLVLKRIANEIILTLKTVS